MFRSNGRNGNEKFVFHASPTLIYNLRSGTVPHSQPGSVGKQAMSEADDQSLSGDEDFDAGSARRERGDMHSVRARNHLREQMQADVERFLQSGGQIKQVPSHVSAERLQSSGEALSESF
jgi:hypothetical protein